MNTAVHPQSTESARHRADTFVVALLCSSVAGLLLAPGCQRDRTTAGDASVDAATPSPEPAAAADVERKDAVQLRDSVGIDGIQAEPRPCDPRGRGRWCRQGRRADPCGAERWEGICRDGTWSCQAHDRYPEGISEDQCSADPVPAPTDAGALADPPPGAACNGPTFSNLPGVRLVFRSNDSCRFTTDEIEHGVRFEFQLAVETDVPRLHPTGSACHQPGPDNGFVVEFTIEGMTDRYCFCDTGYCIRPLADQPLTTTGQRGVYDGSIVWFGRNWYGPSDAYWPEGRVFPPGDYTVTVRAEGTRTVADGSEQPFAVSAQRSFTVVP
jgi:hypothetical protein